MAKLKVFRASLGFFETVVAVPSKKAALEAWGAHQDLFATGAAAPADDKAAVAAALERPGVVLRRPVGSSGAFDEAADLSGLKLPPAKAPTKSKAKPEKATAKPKPPPDRSELNAAEKAVADRKARYDKQRAALDAKRRALEAEAEALRAEFEADRDQLEDKRDRAEASYRKAGG
jgi:hypothetical protein